jgi:mono/diheme cytochrome c family protein
LHVAWPTEAGRLAPAMRSFDLQEWIARVDGMPRLSLLRSCLFGFGAVIAMVATASAQDAGVTPERAARGAEIYALNCSPCHGPRLQGEESAFDLRTFPHDQHERFIGSVTRGKNQMPPWGGLLQPEEIEALWAYVVTGER